MGNTFSQPTCTQCGQQRRHQATGRPGEYCSTRCRQAAHGQRQATQTQPNTEQYDQALRVQLAQIATAAQDLMAALDRPDIPATTPLDRMVRLQVLTERLTPNMVARTKQRGISWEKIGAMLGMNKDTARKKWSLPARRTAQRAAPSLLSPAPPGPTTSPPPGPGSTTDDTVTSEPTPAAAAGTDILTSVSPTIAYRDLATVLSSLQRASGLSLRALASRSKVSPSYLSRLMSGERFPAWKYVAAIARACGADPEVLRKVWEASNARRDSQPRPASLASALRFLHLRAGSPTPWAIAITSGQQLGEDYIVNLLDGTTTGPWEDVQRLIQLLDGEPSYFLPLWEAETPEPAVAAPQPLSVKPPDRDDPPPPGARVEELLNAFKGVLGPQRLTPTVPTRRCLATPIPGATHWSGR
ncbi:helix-turn-helix transcriptional regulator [Streptomyces sp. NPDC005708]|uniref:helix-turn-helix domain-containing protein n=1 Tax=Streptomyces sp. NPDC005708 TaxID=3154564 RepID=UPI00340EBAF6